MQNRLFKGLFLYKTNRFPLSEKKICFFVTQKNIIRRRTIYRVFEGADSIRKKISVPSQFSGAGRPSRNARRPYSFVQLFAMTLRHFRFLSKKINRLYLNNIFVFSSFRLN